jgi:hypothetical protein
VLAIDLEWSSSAFRASQGKVALIQVAACAGGADRDHSVPGGTCGGAWLGLAIDLSPPMADVRGRRKAGHGRGERTGRWRQQNASPPSSYGPRAPRACPAQAPSTRRCAPAPPPSPLL